MHKIVTGHDHRPDDWLTFGEYAISQDRSDPSKIWIGHESGEGGEFNRNEFGAAIKEFYAKHF